MKMYLLVTSLFALSISCNYSSGTKSLTSRTPASIENQVNSASTLEGFEKFDLFLSEAEINETGEAWIYSVRNSYESQTDIRLKVQEAIANEDFPEKLKHELESIDYDYRLERLVKKSPKQRN
jgi:hypothetical protein